MVVNCTLKRVNDQVVCICFRVEVGWAPSSCGHRVMEGESATAATVTDTPTVSTRSPSAAPRSTAMCRGTARPVPQPSPPPTAAETSTRNRLYVFNTQFICDNKSSYIFSLVTRFHTETHVKLQIFYYVFINIMNIYSLIFMNITFKYILSMTWHNFTVYKINI